MLLKIEKLGPLKKSTIGLGDITLLMGPPNTGKSYTLKILYTKLFLFDEYASNIFKKIVMEHIESAIFDEMRSTMHQAFDLALKIAMGRAGAEELNKTGFEVLVESSERGMSIIARKPIAMSLSFDALDRVLKDAAYAVASGSLPQEYIDSSVLEPVDISNFRGYAQHVLSSLYRLGFRDINVPPLNTSEHLLAVIEETLRKPHEASGVVAEVRPVIKLIPTENLLNITIVPTLRAEINAETLDELRASSGNVPKIVVNYRARLTSNKLMKACNETISDILLKSLQTYIVSTTSLDSVRLIPSIKSYTVVEVESASHDPYIMSTHIKAVNELRPTILASYAYWVSRGRGILLSNKLTEEQRKLVRVATPLLEGTLAKDALERLTYKDWRGSTVDVRAASTLVQEVAGILLPLLTVGRSPLILIDEPESQIHPRAQVIMALFITALPRLCNCRVVASTNSDLFAITLAQLAVQKPSKKWVVSLVKELVPHVDEGVDELAEAVAEAVKSIDVRVYEYTQEGKVNQVSLESMLSERIPGITEVLDKVIDWIHNLEISKAREEIDKLESAEAR